MNISEINKQIAIHERAIEILKQQKRNIIIRNNANSNSYDIKSHNDYERCSKIANLINRFYMEKDKNIKGQLFTDEISCFFKDNNEKYISLEDAIDKLNKIETYLNRFLETMLNGNAKEYFIGIFQAITVYDNLE